MYAIPHALAENSGLPALDAVALLRSKHQQGEWWFGINCNASETMGHTTTTREADANIVDSLVLDMQHVVCEPVQLTESVVRLATQAACMIVQIDQVIVLQESLPIPQLSPQHAR